jgi:hypothetical protein
VKASIWITLYFIFSLATILLTIREVSASGTKLLLDPPSTVDGAFTIGTNITLTLAITDVTNLFGYEARIYYNNTMLNALHSTRPAGNFLEPRISPGNQLLPIWNITNTFNATHGRIWLSQTLLSPETARTGSGPLARIVFQILSTGDTTVTMEETKLADSSSSAITHETQNSYFNNNAPPAPSPPLHDAAILDTVPASHQIYIGDILEVTVAIWNKGNVDESFNVILYYNNSFAAIKQVNDLRVGAEHTLIFYWNTSSATEGNYTLKALAVLIPYETNTDDNTSFSTTIEITSKPASVGFTINWVDWLLILLLVLSVALFILWFPFKRKKRFADLSTSDDLSDHETSTAIWILPIL